MRLTGKSNEKIARRRPTGTALAPEAKILFVATDPETGAEFPVTAGMRDEAERLSGELCLDVVRTWLGMLDFKARKLYLALGFESWKQWLAEVPGFALTQAYERLAIAERIGPLLLPKYSDLGICKLSSIAHLPDDELKYFHEKEGVRLSDGTVVLPGDLKRMPYRELQARLKPKAASAPAARPASPPPASDADLLKYYIAAAGKVLRTYEALVKGEEWQGPSEIAKATKTDANTALRCLATLLQEGWIRRQGGKYAVSGDHLNTLSTALGERTARQAAALVRTNESLSRLGGGSR